MSWLIEDMGQLEMITNTGYNEVFLEVLYYNNNIH